MNDNLARVLPFPGPGKRTRRPTRRVVALRRPPQRKARNGHGPDCPYPSRRREFCGICRSEELSPA